MSESRSRFDELMGKVAARAAGRPIDKSLEAELNRDFAPGSDTFEAIRAASEAGVDEGWLVPNENGPVRYGRPIKPSPEMHGFSVDAVKYRDLKGPFHGHPNGEICVVLPTEGDAKFDGVGAGWCVYEAGSKHYPTISDGEAIVLYLLPEGAIDFKARPDA
jgi:hypothetical protein